MKKKQVSLRLENVTKIFKDRKNNTEVIAVNNSTFEIKPGELITLLGPSGCGKTTTLRMVAGFELPTKGKIYIGNEDVTFLPPNKRDTATVFQSYGLFPHMTVFDNVAYGLKLRKLSREEIEKRVFEALEMVGLKDLASRAPSRLSGGQQQRVALARSIIVEPAILLLDEPLSNLDALLREQMRIEIKKIQRKLGITAIYVTHDRVEAMSLSDRIIVMKDGKIMQIGTPVEIYEDPISKFVAGFIGKVAFFTVDVIGKENDNIVIDFKGRKLIMKKYDKELNSGDKGVLMARPESLILKEEKEGLIEGRIKINVYLGNTVESFIDTEYGEIMVQIDNPGQKKIFPEGAAVSIDIVPELCKVFKE
ncbi:ABC transporter [Marinitoga sp. 1135]|uniref:Spermidine/putrescine import ATP-binding protein PotA n=1 Tax=Marinitoga piezophila (strain DSM 14283 / JCM 11233 / KA3) TaxID=443254 RepID=H2J5B5_MARPK|nr:MULTISPECIES: ABC transporter ATP-binding protein [Marinitoga]AEX84973.1 spermidine/putrescine ABC transporter ATP-binding subunit [Marinitoga piezophila KA3]NUU95204.1 ABC transporter [Marinitoga sp. 1135]